MKKFILGLFIFSIPVLLAGISLELLIRRIPNDYVVKRKMLEEHHQTAEILILGNSHALYGINPEYFTAPCINAAHVSQSLDIDLLILEKYFSGETNLKYVILPASYFTPFRTLSTGLEKWRTLNYLIYHDLNVSSELQYRLEITGNTGGVLAKKMRAYYKKKRNPITCSKLGWGTNFSSDIKLDLVESGQARANIHTTDNRELVQANKQTLGDIQKFLAERNISLLLFTPPAFETYTRDLNAQQLALALSIPQELAQNNKNTYYINLLTDSSFDKIDFFDADHLNEIGAEKLSRLINAKIENHEFD